MQSKYARPVALSSLAGLTVGMIIGINIHVAGLSASETILEPISYEGIRAEIKSGGEAFTEAGQALPASPSAEILSEKEQIIAYVREVFGSEADRALAVMACENRQMNPKAFNVNKNGTVDRGLFQLNSAYWGGEENFDWRVNIDKAYEIYSSRGWTPWVCAKAIGESSYLSNR